MSCYIDECERFTCYMSWFFSRALVEASSGAISSDGALYAPWSATPTPPPFSLDDKTIKRSQPFPSGMTCEPLTVGRGEAVLTWCLEAFRVRASASPARAPGSTIPAPDCGPIKPASWAKYNPATSSWRTAQRSLLVGLDEFSGTWPRWGTMRAGAFWGHETPGRPTSVTASGSSVIFPTPTAGDSPTRGNKSDSLGAAFHPKLAMMAARSMWPTPTASDATGGPGQSASSEGGQNLRTAVRMWPTVTDRKNNNAPGQSDCNTPAMNVAVGGQLNPMWVEWLMGWPIGWTDLRPLAMDRFQQWCASHGVG